MRIQVAAILPFPNGTNLLLGQQARAYRSRPRLPQFRFVRKASGTTGVARAWCSCPRCIDRWHQCKTTKSSQWGHDTQIGLGWETDGCDLRVLRELAPWNPGFQSRRPRRLREPKQQTEA